MIYQLGIYEIFEHNKVEFHARFRDHAVRIMRKYGFDIVAMWEANNQQRTEFVYLLVWPDEATKKAAWAKFMADEEWKEIKRVTSAKYGDLVGSIEDRVLFPTDYSPSLLRSPWDSLLPLWLAGKLRDGAHLAPGGAIRTSSLRGIRFGSAQSRSNRSFTGHTQFSNEGGG